MTNNNIPLTIPQCFSMGYTIKRAMVETGFSKITINRWYSLIRQEQQRAELKTDQLFIKSIFTIQEAQLLEADLLNEIQKLQSDKLRSMRHYNVLRAVYSSYCAQY